MKIVISRRELIGCKPAIEELFTNMKTATFMFGESGWKDLTIEEFIQEINKSSKIMKMKITVLGNLIITIEDEFVLDVTNMTLELYNGLIVPIATILKTFMRYENSVKNLDKKWW